MTVTRVAVVGTGAFGQNHLRVVAQNPRATLAAVVDSDGARAAQFAGQYNTQAAALAELPALCDAAIIAVPTTAHAEVAEPLLEAGLDVMIEKPIASTIQEARRLTSLAAARGRVLQVGHLERFNPAVTALEKIVRQPLFFEVHRLSVFSPRSLDVDVVLDLMIHDLEIILALTGCMPSEIRAAGISILSSKEDIANVRLQFPNACVANLTASRVSTEKVRKLRLFQPHEYISLDYSRQDVVQFKVTPPMQIGFAPQLVTKDEPLKLQFDSFLDCIAARSAPRVGGPQASAALEVALAILDKIKEHAQAVNQALAGQT
ncbi:MAG: Gfo/Idh/MocA family oxidoreductase [Acidobacteria bacterium]|nr:Gfo/Idh/MocA family oxidoreductase [Acidobacteriota bacterium]